MLPAENRSFSIGLQHMAAAAFFFSVMSLMVKLTGERLPVFEVVFVRSAVVLATSYGVLHHQRISRRGNNRQLLIMRGLLGFIALNCFYYALIHLPLADATVIQFTNPAFTAIIAVWVLAEWIRAKDIGLILISLAGVVLVAQPKVLFGGVGSGLDPLAVGAGLGGAVLSASAWVVTRKLGRTEASLVIVFYFALVSTLCSIPLVAARFVVPSAVEWVLLVGVGVATHFGQLNLTKGLKMEKAGRAAAVCYLQIVFAALWGLLFFREIPTMLGIAGALLIVGSTLMLRRAPAE